MSPNASSSLINRGETPTMTATMKSDLPWFQMWNSKWSKTAQELEQVDVSQVHKSDLHRVKFQKDFFSRK
uniref:Uncharacterized protein n=1 Tax=Medicago truncatula TaxID=3880 RepID=A2Q159_MEDTR|nr:hypothetical protein MtrDRAFT_AC147963g25v2 [Medicago truncatula]